MMTKRSTARDWVAWVGGMAVSLVLFGEASATPPFGAPSPVPAKKPVSISKAGQAPPAPPTWKVAAPTSSPLPGNASTAEGETPPQSDEAVDTMAERAYQHSQRGKALFGDGKFDAAISEYQAAYRLAPKPIYILNIAKSYRRLEQRREAKLHFKQFIELAPDHKYVGDAAQAIIEIDKYLDQEEALARARRPAWKKGWFWAVLGGVAAAGAGLAVGLALGLKPDQASDDMLGPATIVIR